MLEISILSVIVLAAAYWTALWWMGRTEDVLYGDFVTPGAEHAPTAPREATAAMRPVDLPRRRPAAKTSPPPLPAARPLPARSAPVATPATPPGRIPAVMPPTTVPMTVAAAATTTTSAAPDRPVPSPPPPLRQPVPAAESNRAELLASLLESIKRDLSAPGR